MEVIASFTPPKNNLLVNSRKTDKKDSTCRGFASAVFVYN